MVKVKVIFDYDATQPDELTIKVGDIINDVNKQPGGWWEGSLNGKKGVFPDNFVEDYNVPVNEPPKGPKPGGGKVSDMQKMIGGQIKMGPPPPQAKGVKPKQMAVVLFEYKPEQPDELELMEAEEVEVIRMAEEGWWEGVLKGKQGMFPSNFVKLLDTAPPPSVPGGYPLPGAAPPQNDIGHRSASGSRLPPAEQKPKPMMAAPSNDPSNPPPQLPKRNRGVKARVIYSYHAQNEDELSLQEGQLIMVTDQKLEDPGWWKGELHGRSGVFPDNFVEVIPEEEPVQPPVGAMPAQSSSRGAAAPRGPSIRANKPPPQPPQEPEQPAKLPPRPGPTKHDISDIGRNAPSAMPKPKVEPELPKPQVNAMVNGVDDKAVAMLRDEIEKLKTSMVTRESYELLQRELRATKDGLDTYKKESNKKMLDLMKEIDDEKKQSTQNSIELARIRKLVEDKW